MTIVTRKEAFDKGLTRFYTGVECRRGHTAQRYTANYECVECRKDTNFRSRKPPSMRASDGANLRTVTLQCVHPDDVATIEHIVDALKRSRYALGDSFHNPDVNGAPPQVQHIPTFREYLAEADDITTTKDVVAIAHDYNTKRAEGYWDTRTPAAGCDWNDRWFMALTPSEYLGE